MTKYILQDYLDINLFGTVKTIRCNQWPDVSYTRLNDIDVIAVPVHYACIWRKAIPRSTIPYSYSGFGCVAMRRFDAKEGDDYYNGFLAYAHLGRELKDGKFFGDGLMAVSTAAFLHCVICLNNKDKVSQGERRV